MTMATRMQFIGIHYRRELDGLLSLIISKRENCSDPISVDPISALLTFKSSRGNGMFAIFHGLL